MREFNKESMNKGGVMLSSLRPEIDECKQLKDITKFCNYDSIKNLVILIDLDNTFVRPAKSKDVCSEQFGSHLIKNGEKVLPDRSTAIHSALQIIFKLQQHTQMKAVEPYNIRLINALVALQVPIFALTARSPEIIPATEKQLAEVGVQFATLGSHIDEKLQFTIEDSRKRTIICQNGIIFCDGANKGDALELFLRHMDFKKPNLLMIDDSEKNLLCVRDMAKRMGCSFKGLRYGHLDERVQNFKMEISLPHLLKKMSLFSVDDFSSHEITLLKTLTTDIEQHFAKNESSGLAL